MKSSFEKQLFSASNEHKRSKSEEVNNSQIRHFSMLKQSKSEGEGGPDTISSISKSGSSNTSSNRVLSKKTVDLVLLMKQNTDESPLGANYNRLTSWSSPSSVVSPDANLPSPLSTSASNSTFSSRQLSSGEAKRANSGATNSNSSSTQGSKHDKRRTSSSLFRSKYLAASTLEDLSMACESRDSEEESRIASLSKQQNHARKMSAKSLDSFCLDGCENSVLKIFFIGDEKVGKSSILRRHCENTYTVDYNPTSGVDFKPDIFRYSENSIFKCQLWDACAMKSAESFHVLTQAYFKSVHVFALVFSVQQRASFDNVQRWLETVKGYGQPDACVFLVGNKSEVGSLGETKSREVTFDEAAGLARRLHLPYIETSAATGNNVTLLLEMLMSAAATKVVATSAINKEIAYASNGNTSEEVKTATLSSKTLTLMVPPESDGDGDGEDLSPLTSVSVSTSFSESKSMRLRKSSSSKSNPVQGDSHWAGEGEIYNLEDRDEDENDSDDDEGEDDILYVGFDDDDFLDGDMNDVDLVQDEVKERDSFTEPPKAKAAKATQSSGKKSRSNSASPKMESKPHTLRNNESMPVGRCLPGCSIS